MKNEENKEFKAVEFQRKMRRELSELYNSDPEEFWNRLKAIRNKFKGKFRKKGKAAA